MYFLRQLLQASLLLSSATSTLAASWTFTDATVSIKGKNTGVGSVQMEKLSPTGPLAKALTLTEADSLKLLLTTQEGKTAKRPHQAFLLLEDPTTKLDISYPLSVKESGKAQLSLTTKDLPSQFLRASKPISASIVIGSFGSAAGYKARSFTLTTKLETPAAALSDKPLRYGKLPEIHHIFRSDPKSPPAIISLVFAGAVLATLPFLLGTWLYMGGNINHVSKALSDAPISHAVFLGSVVGVEGVLFLYYTSWNLFQALPVLGVLGVVALVSGSRALTEVQDRRLAGLR